MQAIEMLRGDGKDYQSNAWAVRWRPTPMTFRSARFTNTSPNVRTQLPPESLELFHLGRRIRNRIIHYAGEAGSGLPREYRAMSKTARAKWKKVTGRPLTTDARGRLDLSEGELLAVLSTTRHLAAEINMMMVPTISRQSWASLVVADYRALEPQRFGERSQRLRRLRGHARLFYGPLALTEKSLRTPCRWELRGGLFLLSYRDWLSALDRDSNPGRPPFVRQPRLTAGLDARLPNSRSVPGGQRGAMAWNLYASGKTLNIGTLGRPQVRLHFSYCDTPGCAPV